MSESRAGNTLTAGSLDESNFVRDQRTLHVRHSYLHDHTERRTPSPAPLHGKGRALLEVRNANVAFVLELDDEAL